MNVFVNSQKITLSKTDYLATGGEAILYRKGNSVYKIFHDKKNLLPKQKWIELSTLTDPRVIRPENPILDDKGSEIGYTMPFIQGDELCRLFTQSFKNRNVISNDNILHSIIDFRTLIEHVHSKHILVVDLNELNFLYNKEKIYGIDVNSYQTKSFPATVLMDSVRDWTTKTFTEITDWYSWGIVTLQMLVGVHAYKGTHPKYTGQITDRMKQRALDHISIFNKAVGIPDWCDLDIIPKGLREWYISEFEQGKRTIPPKNFDTIVKKSEIKLVNIISSALNIEPQKVPDKTLSLHYVNGLIIRGEKGTYKNKEVMPKCDYILSIDSSPLLVAQNEIYCGKLKGLIDLAHEGKFLYNNHLFLVTSDDIIRVDFTPTPTKILVSYRKECGRLPSIKYGDGCIIQDIFGDLYILPRGVKLPKILKGNVLDCKWLDPYLMIILSDKGIQKTYLYNNTTQSVKEIDSDEINFTIHKGIPILVTNKGILLIGEKSEKLIINHGLKNLKIISFGTQMYAYNENQLLKISVK